MEKKTKYEELKKRLEWTSNEINEAVDKLEAIEFKTKVDLFEDIAKRLLPVRWADPNSGTFADCMNWSVGAAWEFAEKMYEFVTKKAQEQAGSKERRELKNDIATEIVNKMTDDFIVQEVYDRGLIADVLFTNEELVESYGYVRKNETEF